MTGPSIPADQWPENAVAMVWNDEGHGRRLTCVRDEWILVADMTPMPAGHDWRVPVMRPTVKDSLTVATATDLEQFRGLAHRLHAYPHDAEAVSGALLALIDGQASQHPGDVAVDVFAAAMKAKLAAARAKGRGGWAGDEPGMQQRLSNMLREHVTKGDPVDVANFAMFLHQRGEGIMRPGKGEEVGNG